MKEHPSLIAILLLAACGREAAMPMPVQSPSGAVPRPSAELVDILARDPERLKEIRRQCREDRAHAGEELCIASALAVRKRFLGDRGPRVAPKSGVDADAEPAPGPPQE